LKLKRIILLIICCILLSAPFCAAASATGENSGEYEYGGNCVYVSDSGDDSNDGKKDTPVKTLKTAFGILASAEKAGNASDGYIIVKDTVTLFDSEDGKKDNKTDPETFNLDLSGIKHKNKITVCGADDGAEIGFANGFTGDYSNYEAMIRFGGPAAFDNIRLAYSNGRVRFESGSLIEFGRNVTCEGSIDFYIQASGTVKLESGQVSHLFAPTANAETTVILGGSARVGSLWLGLGSFKKTLNVMLFENASVGTVYVGGQSVNFTGTTNFILAGGYTGAMTSYDSGRGYKGTTNVLVCGANGTLPVTDSGSVFAFDQSASSAAENLSGFAYDGVLKATGTENPKAEIENGFVEVSYTVKAVKDDGSQADYPLPFYVLSIPEKYVLSENFAVYAFKDGAFVNCGAMTADNFLVFAPVEGAEIYSIVHMGKKAEIHDAASPEYGQNKDGIDLLDSDKIVVSEPGYDASAGEAADRSGPITTAIIVISIIAVTAAAEMLILRGGKKKKTR